ncbi:hypothetical protein OG426_51020 [Streptomyces canus]|uniref:hypothetical protein n=1 Tax=Streptomyces canus TaxID=58343 RepID=UPI003864156B|nr:hypothetical protein OG426_51020 [Streptomyces canus]
MWAERGSITRLTGVAFGTGYDRALSRGTTVLDSTAAAAGPAALRDQPGISELDAAEAIGGRGSSTATACPTPRSTGAWPANSARTRTP